MRRVTAVFLVLVGGLFGSIAHWRWVAMNSKSEATKQAVFTYPAEIPPMLKLSDKEFARELWFLGVAKLYELGRLSSGKKAARLAGLVGAIQETR
jgi:hypothetical protein